MRLEDESENGTPVDIEISRGKFEDGVLADSTLYILLPRNLFAGTDIKSTILDACKADILKQGKPKPRSGAAEHHRPMFAYFLVFKFQISTFLGFFI